MASSYVIWNFFSMTQNKQALEPKTSPEKWTSKNTNFVSDMTWHPLEHVLYASIS